jgi:6,7-dimethyl-8-ribityllumazine synthase
VAVVVAAFNRKFTARLLRSARARLREMGAGPITVEQVPGAYELGFAAKELAATSLYDAVVALGCVIRGETSHYDLVCLAASEGVMRAAMDTRVPVAFGVITCENEKQAAARCSGGSKDSGRHAAETAIWMARQARRIRHGA